MTDPLARESNTQWEIHEHLFRSDRQVIGGFIARFRSAWHSVAGKWADRAIIQQQNEYNHGIAQQFAKVNQQLAEVDQQSAELDQRLIYTDRDLIELTRTVAELAQKVIQLQRALEAQQTDLSAAGQDANHPS